MADLKRYPALVTERLWAECGSNRPDWLAQLPTRHTQFTVRADHLRRLSPQAYP